MARSESVLHSLERLSGGDNNSLLAGSTELDAFVCCCQRFFDWLHKNSPLIPKNSEAKSTTLRRNHFLLVSTTHSLLSTYLLVAAPWLSGAAAETTGGVLLFGSPSTKQPVQGSSQKGRTEGVVLLPSPSLIAANIGHLD